MVKDLLVQPAQAADADSAGMSSYICSHAMRGKDTKQVLLERYGTTSYVDRLSFYAWDFELGF